MVYLPDDLLDALGDLVEPAVHDDVLPNIVNNEEFRITPANFRNIPSTANPRRVAFVDGGNGTIIRSPGFFATINRLYSCTFCGSARVRQPRHPRVEFFSLVTHRMSSESEGYGMKHSARLFVPHREHGKYVPPGDDVASGMRHAAPRGSQMESVARGLGEWLMAREVAGTLERGDMLVMDGSLTALDRIESKYAQNLYDVARSRGVIVCALSKTSHLLTRGGEPLLERARSISEETGLERWYVNVADQLSSHDSGFVMAVQLHGLARYAFRFEILREQHARLSDGEKDHILASLASNSGDASFLGYPYGLVDADRYAQIRRSDVVLCRELLQSRARATLGSASGYMSNIGAHDHLNGVTS